MKSEQIAICMCYYFDLQHLFLLSLPCVFVCTSQSWQIYSVVSFSLSTHFRNTTNSIQGSLIATSVPPLLRQVDINMHVHTAGLQSQTLSLGSAFKVESLELPTPSNHGLG